MLFSTYRYFVFLLAVLVLLYALPRWRTVLLLIASYFFYISWNWRFVPLLLGLTAIDYAAAIWIERSQGAARRAALLVSLAANLGFLGFFKYYNFAATNFAVLLGLPTDTWRLAIILPLGISFHTFQSISYVVDVYRGEQKAIRRPCDYALFISFFPQLVAGPIVRAQQFFADHDSWTPPPKDEALSGVFLIVMGLVKKVALADNLAPIVDAYFGASHPTENPWLAVLAFALQIFFDFSGYTDIAIGSARLLGYRFPENFRRPYLAVSVTDFWRRWHISLSTWLRDYVYIPLGGNRRGAIRTYLNLLLTMLLGGLWHGANWTFLVWGGYHGALLAAERLFGISRTSRRWSWKDALRTLVTLMLVCIGWVFFRSSSLRQAFTILGDMSSPSGTFAIEPALLFLIVGAVILTVCQERWGWLDRIASGPLWTACLAMAALLFIAEIFGSGAALPFVYFQF